ncbi:MAG: chromate transporter [Chloroflexi bacterium]|nr:chromate transporter [Chloroflexota bacterium]
MSTVPSLEENKEEVKVRSKFIVDMRLFWIFLKVNLLTTAGPTSVGLLYKETVGKIMTEAKFVEAVGFANLVPGSEALKLAMFIGYSSGGVPGLLAALLGAIVPPTTLMFVAAFILTQLEDQVWMSGFIRGMGPAVGVLLVLVAWQLFPASGKKSIKSRALLIAVLSFISLVVLKIPPQYVLIGAGVLGLFIFR